MARDINVPLTCTPFVIDETPFVFWSSDAQGENLRFLEGLRPSYFGYLSRTHGAVLADDSSTPEDRQFAATALRNAYAQALETFFALIGAALQAPDAPVAYVLKYRDEIGTVVDKISSNGALKTRWVSEPLTWEQVADLVMLSLGDITAERRAMNVEGFARQWRRFAQDFRDESRSLEHNSIKHGLRLRMGGMSIQIGIPESPGREPANMVSLGASEFGSSYYVANPVNGSRHNIHLRERSLAWNPHQLAWDLNFLQTSIENVVAFLKHQSGAGDDQIQMAYASDPEAFTMSAKAGGPRFSFEDSTSITVEQIALWSKDEIVASYDPEPVEQSES
ncbi:hypothetical protein HLB42_07885 [Deinococcus sp. D7000]|nr:hypothetical protein HLB42_07885 [Deinococcus sp. D7000]